MRCYIRMRPAACLLCSLYQGHHGLLFLDFLLSECDSRSHDFQPNYTYPAVFEVGWVRDGEYWPRPVTVSLLEVEEVSSKAACLSRLPEQTDNELSDWTGNPGCERSASMWGQKEASGQSGEEYLANTWSCSGWRLASLQTLWHNAETVWHVFNFSWLSWLFSINNFSLSVFCDIHMQYTQPN